MVDNRQISNLRLMGPAELNDQLKQIIGHSLGYPPHEIQDHQHLIKELYADSVGLIDMMLLIQKQLAIELSEEEVSQMQTVADVYRLVWQHYAGQ